MTRHLVFPPIIGRNRQSQKCERFFTLSQEEPDPAGKLLPAGRPGAADRGFRARLITISGTTRAPAISRRPTSTSAVIRSSRKGYASRKTPLKMTLGPHTPSHLTSTTRSQSLPCENTPPDPINLTMDPMRNEAIQLSQWTIPIL